jgi:hypothetical protein
LTSLIKLTASFLTANKFRVSVEEKFSVPRKIVAEVPQGSDHAPILYSLHINDAPAASYLYLHDRNVNIVFSANCNAASLQGIRGVRIGT